MPTDYKKLFAIQSKLEKQLKLVCPEIDSKSGIYFITRKDDDGAYFYIGKALSLSRRMVSHLQGYQQRIDISLKKRGFYSEENTLGWKLNVIHFGPDELNEKERYYIDKYQKAGWITYNIESGGTTGKEIIGERKPAKTYTDGIKQGRKKTREEVKTYFDKYLDFTIKPPTNKIKERKFSEFTEFLHIDDEVDKTDEKDTD